MSQKSMYADSRWQVHGSDSPETASARLDEIEALFKSYLGKEFDEAVSGQRAVSIMLHIFEIRVYGYQQGSAERMRQGLREGLPWKQKS